MSRPDTSWRFVDKNGHEHRWHADGKPADRYSPDRAYTVPSVTLVVDCEATETEGPYSHLECAECGDHVVPGTTADTTRQHISGPIKLFIDGRRVTRDEFNQAGRAEFGRRWKDA